MGKISIIYKINKNVCQNFLIYSCTDVYVYIYCAISLLCCSANKWNSSFAIGILHLRLVPWGSGLVLILFVPSPVSFGWWCHLQVDFSELISCKDETAAEDTRDICVLAISGVECTWESLSASEFPWKIFYFYVT